MRLHLSRVFQAGAVVLVALVLGLNALIAIKILFISGVPPETLSRGLRQLTKTDSSAKPRATVTNTPAKSHKLSAPASDAASKRTPPRVGAAGDIGDHGKRDELSEWRQLLVGDDSKRRISQGPIDAGRAAQQGTEHQLGTQASHHGGGNRQHDPESHPPSNHQQKVEDVEVWSKASIGEYFQEAIMGAKVEPKLGGVWFKSTADCGRYRMTYRAGDGVVVDKVPKDPKYVVLILQARSAIQQREAKVWLEILPTLEHLQGAGVVLLGEESCTNAWFERYLKRPEFKIRFVFMVYGGKSWVDYKVVFPWPLGVATYRGFPSRIAHDMAVAPLPLRAQQQGDTAGQQRNINMLQGGDAGWVYPSRKYLCNLQATIYRGSSREKLLAVLVKSGFDKDCFINARTQWQAHETSDSAAEYRQILHDSDYTLSPAGLSTECYRHYEAAALGSIPIVEDVIKPEQCGQSPIQILKELGAPFVFLSSWDMLPSFLQAAKSKSPHEKYNDRVRLREWYDQFHGELRAKFCSVLSQAFSPPTAPRILP